MKRILAVILSLLLCTGVFADESLAQILTYLPMMPEVVKAYENENKIDEAYIGFVFYEGLFYHSILDKDKALQSYNKAKKLLKQYPEIAKKVSPDLIKTLYEASYAIENLETTVEEEPLAKYFKSKKYKKVLLQLTIFQFWI